MSEFFPALRIFIFLTCITGFAYPIFVTGIAQIGFKEKANGSLIEQDGKIIASELITQKFEKPYHFWSRPSAIDYNPMPSGGSNLGPTSADLKAKVEERQKLGLTREMLFASASGLDPHISPEAAKDQVSRIIASLKLPLEKRVAVTQIVMDLVDEYTEKRQFNLFGDPHVNVFRINLELTERLKRSGIRLSP